MGVGFRVHEERMRIRFWERPRHPKTLQNPTPNRELQVAPNYGASGHLKDGNFLLGLHILFKPQIEGVFDQLSNSGTATL